VFCQLPPCGGHRVISGLLLVQNSCDHSDSSEGDGKPGMVARFLQCGRNRPQLRTLAGYCNLYSVETCLLQVSWVIIRCSKGERTNMSLV
jgi:hypothetical protein